MTSDTDNIKYPQLFNLVKAILSLSHGNVSVESGFSINKVVLDAHGKSLKENAIDDLRLVKDYLVRCNSYLNVSITKLILKSVKDFCDKYNIELEEQRKLELKLKAELNKVKKIAAKETEDANKNKW